MKRITLITLFSLFVSIIFSVEDTNEGILFSYDGNAKSVFLVGSMNGWNESGIPMEKYEDGVWRITLELSSGKHTYKFIIDGDWKYDEENPSFEDDGYGGMNSMIEIGQDGGMIQKANTSRGVVVSPFNKKINFNGRYLSSNTFLKNETDRFMLDKPQHDLNLGINIEFNSDFEGYTVLNINNTKEESDMWKTHFNYKRTYLEFKADYINVVGFDNFGMFTFDNPLHIIGDIGYNGYNFGYDYSGVYIETSDLLSDKIFSFFPIAINGQFIFSDKIGYDEDDITAMRFSISSSTFNSNLITIGASNYKYRIKVTGEDLIQNHDNHEFDLIYKKDFYQSGWKDPMGIEFSVEYSVYENSNEFFNQDSLESWMEGQNIFLGSSIEFPSALKIYVNHLRSSFELMETKINFSRSRITFGGNLKIKNFSWNLGGQYWKNDFQDDFSWSNYYEYIAKTDANGRWFQQHSELPFEKYTVLGYESGFLWESDLSYKGQIANRNLETTLKNKFAHHSLSTEAKFIESIVVFKYDISDKWKFKIDTRIPYYNDSFLDIKTDFSSDEDVFISNYSEISYYLSKDVWLSLGYGVNPRVMNPVTDEFYNRGREDYLNYIAQLPEYLESYYVGFGDKIRSAEKSLMNEKSISLQAVMEF